MTDKRLASLLEAVLVNETAAAGPRAIDPGERMALLAALFDGGLGEEGRANLLAGSFAELQDTVASLAFLDAVREPTVVPGVPRSDWFRPLAAASKTGDQAMVCHSDSGLWKLEVFVGQSERDRTLQQGYLLLTIDSEHRAAYEGRSVRVFVKADDEKRVLLEKVVHDGEVFAPISLAGLDLRAKDPIGIEYATPPEGLREA
jgi:hypothetical protein